MGTDRSDSTGSDDVGTADGIAYVVSVGERHVRSAVAAMGVPPGCVALCIWGGEDPDVDDAVSPEYVFVATSADRQRALAAPEDQRFAIAWGSDYAFDAPCVDPRLDPEYRVTEARLVAALKARGVLDPSRVVLNRIARRLTEAPPVPDPSADFLAFAGDTQMGEDLAHSLRYSASAATAAALRSQGLFDNPLGDDPSE